MYMRWLGSSALLVVVVCGCATPNPTPSGAPFTVRVPPPGEADELSIVQGGELLFEVGSAAVHYEVQMSNDFSSDALTLEVTDLPTGVFVPESDVASLSAPFSLEAGAVRNGVFTLWANNTAIPGVYMVTVTVSGTVSPGSTAEREGDTFSLTVTARQ